MVSLLWNAVQFPPLAFLLHLPFATSQISLLQSSHQHRHLGTHPADLTKQYEYFSITAIYTIYCPAASHIFSGEVVSTVRHWPHCLQVPGQAAKIAARLYEPLAPARDASSIVAFSNNSSFCSYLKPPSLFTFCSSLT